MNDVITQVLAMAWSAWRWRGYGLLATWFVCLVGWVAVAIMPDSYRSSAVVYVDTASILQPLLKGLTIESDTAAELELMQRTLLSRPNLEKVMRETDLDLTVADPAQIERLVGSLGSRISVTREQSRGAAARQGRSDLFRIEFEDPNPVLARDVVQAVLNMFVESNLGQNRQDMDSARRFIEEQIRDYEIQLTEAERRIARFRRDNIDLLSLSGREQRPDRPNQLEAARQKLAKAEAEVREAQVRREALRRELSEIPQFLPAEEGGGFGPPTNTQVQILDQQAALEDLLARYTDQHPDVVVARRKLEALQQQQQEELEAAAASVDRLSESAGPADKAVRGPSNPVYEQIKIQLVQEEAAIATLRDAVAEARAGLRRLQELSEGVPEVEAELVKLNRDYDVLRASYDALLSSRETERISRARDLQAEDVRFRILEPPEIPAVPSGPKRLLFLAAVLIVGVGSGVAFAVMLALSGDTFLNVIQIKEKLAIPVLGTISTSEFTRQSLWAISQSVVFWSALLLLVTAFSSLTLVELKLGLSQAASSELLSKLPVEWLRRLPIY